MNFLPPSRSRPFGASFLWGRIARWHDIAQGIERDDQQVDYLVVVIRCWREGQVNGRS